VSTVHPSAIGIGLVPGTDPLEIFAESLIPHIMLAFFDGPVVAA
jgi:hypothetical protein